MNDTTKNDNIKKNFNKKCPLCKNVIIYTTYSGLWQSIKKNIICRSCKDKNRPTERICPKCKQLIKYKLYEWCKRAEKIKSLCLSCTASNRTGEKNAFYGKHHTKETIEKIINNRDQSFTKTKEFKEKQSKLNSGKNNHMYGRSFYSVWLKKFGKEIADKKLNDYKSKQSELNSGKNNPMYGKPSPNGSGQGWKGWYKKHFFRSLRELSYMIYLEENNINWETGESKKFTVEYKDYKGNDRTTRPDFFLNNNKIVEIKPIKLHNSPSVLAKKNAMENFSKNRGYEYELIDINIDYNKLKKSYNNKEIVFMKNYEQKFLNWKS